MTNIELITRLRTIVDRDGIPNPDSADVIAAADAIEIAQAEIERLKSQNKTFAKLYDAEHDELVRLGEQHDAALARLAELDTAHCGIKDLRDYKWLDPQCAGGGCQSLVIAAGGASTAKDANPNAPWLSEAHMLCTDLEIPPGDITERIQALRKLMAPFIDAKAIASAPMDRTAMILNVRKKTLEIPRR